MQIKAVIPIDTLIAQHVHTPLKASSHGFSTLCPFHDENTPSFHIYTDTQSYYCFGCHASGDIFSFIMNFMHITFPEALKLLAAQAGITLTHYERNSNNILTLSDAFFTSAIRAPHAAIPKGYMSTRSLSEQDIARFSLGYAPSSWNALTEHLRQSGLSDKDIVSSGMAIQSERGNIYDRFRGRLMFTIRNVAGQIIAFGGRLIDGEGAKYMNSPESKIYHKRANLYLLDKAHNAMREKGRSILVEGYMDAIRLHKSGFNETVASLGTSLTKEQAALLNRFTDRCYICYDSDSAGQNAALRSMYILAEEGLDVNIIQLPSGKDPDEYLCTHSAEDFSKLIESSKPLITHHLSMIVPRLNDRAGRKKVLHDFFSQLSRLDYLDVLDHKAEICDALYIQPSDLERYVHKPERLPEESHTEAIVPDDNLECAVCALLSQSQDLRMSIDIVNIHDMLSDESVRKCYMDIMTGATPSTEGLTLISRGREFLSGVKEVPECEAWKRIYSSLKWRQITRRLEEIDALPIRERPLGERIELMREREKYTR